MSLETLERLVSTYLNYSYPESSFAFQGGEPTLAGLRFFESLVRLQKQYARPGQAIANSMQTNGVLLNAEWCQFFHRYNWLIGLSLDGPEEIHDKYRINRAGKGSYAAVMRALGELQKAQVDFNVLCVLTEANVGRAAELYRFYRALGVEHLQFIPHIERGQAQITGDQYGRFLCELFDVWWPERRHVRIRHFDNIAEAVAGMLPSTCTMHESCDTYAVVEYNGDVYPCDFFVEPAWKLGNVMQDDWGDLEQRLLRRRFAEKKAEPHDECARCEYRSLCHGGCPKLRTVSAGKFQDLDWFCAGYKAIFGKSVEPLKSDLRELGLL